MENEIKRGSRHSAGDQKLVQEIHDRALALGAASPQASESKSENLEKDVQDVRSAFYDQFGSHMNAPSPVSDWWVVEVWDDHAIICAGSQYYRVSYTRAGETITFAPHTDWTEVEEKREWVDVVKALQAKAAQQQDTFVTYGSAVKALGNGKVGGYLVRFTKSGDFDLTDDRFDAVKSDLGEPNKLPVLYHHGLDGTLKRRRIGTGETRRDDVGLWIESQLEMRDAYEKAIYDLAEKGKLSWSSGAASHTVEREADGKGALITQWFISEASLTPTPAEPRNRAVSIKALPEPELDLALPEAESEVGNDVSGDNAADAANVKTAAAHAVADSAAQSATNEAQEMTPEELKAVVQELKTEMVGAAQTAVAEAIKPMQDQLKALKDAPPTTPPGGVKTNPGNGQHKTPLGDDAFKAFGWYLKTGDPSGIRTGEAFEQMLRERHTDALKTTYTLLESTQYQGQEAVPTEVIARIIERRDPISVARAAGAEVIQVGSNAFVLPIEKASPENFVITTIDGSNTFDQTTVQPMDKLAGTIYLFTKSVPIDMNLLDDSVFGIENWWSRRMGRAWGLTENAYFLMGTGSSQPQGAVYASTLGVTAASGTAVTAAELVDHYHKVPAEYRDNLAWIMRGATEGAVRKLTVSTQFPFVGQGGANGGVGTSGLAQGQGWLVSPSAGVYNSDGMDALTTSKKPIFIGNLAAGYVIAERKGLTVFRDPYSLSTKGLVNILAHFRETGGVTNALALYHLLTPSA